MAKKTRMMFVRVALPGSDESKFFNVTRHLGEPLAYSKPLASCAAEVNPDQAAFSVLRYTRKAAKEAKGKPLSFPIGAVYRLLRSAPDLPELEENQIVMRVDGEETKQFVFSFERDTEIPTAIHISDLGPQMTISKRPLSVDMFMRSPLGRVVAVGYLGHSMGRPGTERSWSRVCSNILNFMTGLPNFRTLTNITAVGSPREPSRKTLTSVEVAPQLLIEMSAVYADGSPVVGGLKVEVDMEIADGIDGRFGLSITDSSGEVPVWAPLVDEIIHEGLLSLWGGPDEAIRLAGDIVLGELTPADRSKLKSGFVKLGEIRLPSEVPVPQPQETSTPTVEEPPPPPPETPPPPPEIPSPPQETDPEPPPSPPDPEPEPPSPPTEPADPLPEEDLEEDGEVLNSTQEKVTNLFG